MKRTALSLLSGAIFLAAACSEQTPPAKPTPSAGKPTLPARVADAGPATAPACLQDADCTAGTNGRCLPNSRLNCAGQCSYDACFSDLDCPASQPCECRESASDSAANSCLVGSNCRIDADCGSCGFCSPTPVSPLCVCDSPAFCNPPDPHGSCGDSCGHGYFCHTPKDTCWEDSDCTGHDRCNFDLPSQAWVCTFCGSVP